MTSTLYTDLLWPGVSSNNAFHATLTAVGEVLTGAIGTGRTVPPTLLGPGAYETASDEKLGGDLLVRPLFDVKVVEYERTGAIAPETADRSVCRIGLQIRLGFSTASEVEEDLRLTVRAAFLHIVDACLCALAYAGNLASTAGGENTNLVGAALIRKGPARVVREDWAKRLFISEFEMTGLIQQTL